MQQVYNYLENKLKHNEIVVVAISGGPDSMALLDILLKIKKNIKIVVAHVNHNVRTESEQEKIFVENYCKKNNIIFEYMKIDKYTNNKFSEVEARKKRYDFFESLLKKHNANYLLTAHHGDDLVETVLMRIVRGSSLKGYSGFKMESKYKNYTILRPLILVTKKDILDYLNKEGIEFVIDKSNEQDYYTRNRYRKNILPSLKQENNNVHLKFKKFSDMLNEYDNYVDKVSYELLEQIKSDKGININEFVKLEKLIQKRIINILLENIYKENIMFLNDNHIDNILKLIKNSKDNGYLNLPNNILVKKEYGYLNFTYQENEKNDYYIELKDKVNLPNGKHIEIIDSSDLDNNYICRLSKDEVEFPIYVRNKKIGDKMYIKNMNGSRKISDIYIDCKIPKKDRDILPVVVDKSDKIVWLPGIKKSKFDRTKNEKYDIILKYD